MNTIFTQLKWSILAPPSEAQIFSLDADDNPQWTPLTYAIAGEPATTPSKPRLQVRLEPLLSWEYWQQAEQEAPPLLAVQNTNDQDVSARQFRHAVHEYAVHLGRLLCRCCDIYGEEEEGNARFYFSLVAGVGERMTCPEVQLHVIEDTDGDGIELKAHLEFIEMMYRQTRVGGQDSGSAGEQKERQKHTSVGIC